MKRTFAISFFAHLGLILSALLVLPAPPPFKVAEPTPITVDISAISDKVQQQAATKDDAPDAKDNAPKEAKPEPDTPPAPKVADKVKLAAHEPKPEDPVPPEPKPDPPELKPVTPPDTAALDKVLADDAAKQAEEQKKLDDKKKADEKKKADDKKKAERKKKLDAALAEAQLKLSKIAGESAAPAKASDKSGTPKHGDKNAAGNDAAATATIASALASKVKGCFNIPPAAREANVSVLIHFILNRDGSVQGQPEATAYSADPVVQATARAAISAIVECQMYELPADQYDLWKENTLDFNPTQLSG